MPSSALVALQGSGGSAIVGEVVAFGAAEAQLVHLKPPSFLFRSEAFGTLLNCVFGRVAQKAGARVRESNFG